MHRETERLARGMNLAPDVVVKKKLSFTDFFARVGYKTAAEQAPPPAVPAEVKVINMEANHPVAPAEETPSGLEVVTSLAFAPELEEDNASAAAGAMHDDEIELPTLEPTTEPAAGPSGSSDGQEAAR